MSSPDSPDPVEIRIDSMAHGGEGVGRVDGKAHFVPGVLPGEKAIGRVVHDAGNWARAQLVAVVESAPSRIEPRCPHAAECGGCQWQHARYEAQLEWKAETVTSQLEHLGKMANPPVNSIVAPGPPFGYRNRMEFKVHAGRPAMFRSRSRDLVSLDVCELLEPRLADVFARMNRLDGASAVTLRIGANTGDALAVVTGSLPEEASSWRIPLAIRHGKSIRGIDAPPRIYELINEVRFRITGTAFFQANSAGAATLVDLVRAGLEPSGSETLLDAYAGVGLFGASLGDDVGRVVAVESDRTAADDLRANLASAGVEHRVIQGRVERVVERLDEYAELVVADPPRTGLGAPGVAAVTASAPRRLAYVSCDPASLARDGRLLREAGYEMLEVTPVDMFPQTYHIEAVAIFARSDSVD